MSPTEPRWTIADLGAAVARALAAGGYAGQPNGQVRDVPDARTIRYYTSLGLVDRPAEVRGRTAYYGRRHLLQIAAVKRLQAAGKSLVEVQRELAGLTDGALERVAAVPSDLGPPPEPPLPPAPSRPAAFWAARPAPATAARTVQLIPLSEGVTLAVDAAVLPTAGQLADLRTAARPLLEALRAHGLVPPDPTPEAP